MEKKLASLQVAFATHKKSMKDLEDLALAANGDAHGGVENPLDPVGDGENNELELERQESSGKCSASVGLEKVAATDVNVRTAW